MNDEALKCLEFLKKESIQDIAALKDSSITKTLNDVYFNAFDTIEEAIKPKNYLKWNQIRNMPREFKVKMGKDVYIVKYEYWGATDIDVLLFQTNGLFMFNLHESFIENLRLEVIEE